MTLEQLRYFKAVVEQGSFRAAAEKIFRSQSSLSISIQKLEQELGLNLFIRDHYRPTLTEAGEAIYQKALVLLQKSDALTSLAHHLSIGCEPEITLAISGIVPIEPIIQVLNHINHLHPETKISLQVENLGGTMERLRDADADIAITDTFEFESDYESLQLTSVEFVVVVPGSSPWAALADIATEQQLEAETLIIVRDTSNHSTRHSKGLYHSSRQWVVNDFTTKQRIIQSGTGWGRMPLHLIEEDIALGNITMLTSPGFKPVRADVMMVRNKHRMVGPVEKKLWELLQAIDWPQ